VRAAGGERVGVQLDAHRVLLLAEDADLTDAGDGGEALDQVALGVVRQLQPVEARRAEEEDHDRRGVGVGLGYLGRVGLLRQGVGYARNGVAHVVGGVVDVAPEGEFDADARGAVAAGRADAVDALDAGDLRSITSVIRFSITSADAPR
jgi:hypothetical protein